MALVTLTIPVLQAQLSAAILDNQKLREENTALKADNARLNRDVTDLQASASQARAECAAMRKGMADAADSVIFSRLEAAARKDHRLR
jgi:uncharacterized protein YlxW (UPF0749 family)